MDVEGNMVYGETAIDEMKQPPQELMLHPNVQPTREALQAVGEADLILVGPGSFYTSLMPILLMEEMAQALRRTPATMVFIGNLGRELSPAAASLSVADKLQMMERYIGKRVIDALVVSPAVDTRGIENRLIVREPLEAADINIVTTASCYGWRWNTPFRALTALRGRNKQRSQFMQLIAHVGRLFELQVLSMLLHLPFQLVDLLLQSLRR